MDFHLSRLLPFLNWPRPTAASLKRDAWAGISVALVLIPQAIAYATLAGMPPQTGLYAALLPSVIGILWGSSALLAIGPVALTSFLVFGTLSPLALPGSAEWVALAIWLSIYSGVIQFFLGAFKLGGIAALVSQPVITGFVNAAAIIIIASQLPALVGIPDLFSRDFIGMIDRTVADPTLPLMTAAFGGGALMLMLIFKHFLPRFPAILLVTVTGIAASWMLGFASHDGAIVGEITAGMPPLLLLPALPFDDHRQLWSAALIIALISFAEAMSSCRVLARKRREQWDENQELIGQGLAKVVSGFSGAFPVSGSFSRSALNLYSGAASAWSSLFSALCVLLCLLFLTDLISYLPRSVLAAMIIIPVWGLLDLPAFRRIFSISRDDGAVAAVTFALTLITMPRVHWGVFAGIALTMVSFLYRRTHPRIIEIAPHPDGTLRDRKRFELPALAPGLIAVRMDDALNFLTGAKLERFILERCRRDKRIGRVLFSAGSINDIDASGLDMLEALLVTLRAEGITLYMSGVKKQVWDVLLGAGTIARIGSEHVFATDSEAIRMLTKSDEDFAV
ncbi:MAG: sodium-independent anion transporter [Burkholderiales bacterium RIFCSPLOWO2_02_FULL_57_36]|nr:MAG: sodium-independent anion transporter [Burkholderiales bacterium RIFCSPLOWO2_02_FULL_57_36]